MTTDTVGTRTVKRLQLPMGCADRVAAEFQVTAAYVRMIVNGTRAMKTEKGKAIKAAVNKEIALEQRKIKKLTA